MSKHIIAVSEYIWVYVVLMLLLGATIGADMFNLGMGNTIVALVIAALKACLVILFFMHVRYSSGLTWIFVLAGFFWLGILISLSLSDYLTRGTVLGMSICGIL